MKQRQFLCQYTCEVGLNPVQFCFSLVDIIHLLANERHFHLDSQPIRLVPVTSEASEREQLLQLVGSL